MRARAASDPAAVDAPPRRTICWAPLWNPAAPAVGLEHLLLSAEAADGLVLAVDEQQGPFRLAYRLRWDQAWCLREADLAVEVGAESRRLVLRTDGRGAWHDAAGRSLPALDGCIDIDIWPTPFTNTFPLRRSPPAAGERREYRMAWVSAPGLTVGPQRQAYTALGDRRWRFESLDGSGFRVELTVDEENVVIDYPGLFRRIPGDTSPG